MRILILTQYFPPEIGAPQNRLFELAVRLKQQGVEIDVLTAMPNYPKMEVHEAYKNKFYSKEIQSDLNIFRSWIYVTKSKGVFKRLLNYFSFVFSSLIVGVFKLKGNYDLVITESPPLFLGISGYILSKFKRAKFNLNVSDLWPESAEKLGLVTNRKMLKAATVLEEFLYEKSLFVTGQTQGIVKDIKTRFPEKEVYWLPNGVDVSLFNPDIIESGWRIKNGFSKNDKLFLYAGIIGLAQGLEVILKAAVHLKELAPNVKFILLGAGPVKEELMEMKSELDLNNVFFHEPVQKSQMGEIIRDVDAAVVPLKKMDLFLGAIPSKIFENLAMKKPIILGVDGEARDLFEKEGNCAIYFEPENVEDLVAKIVRIEKGEIILDQLGRNGRQYVEQKFDRNILATNYLNFLKEQIESINK